MSLRDLKETDMVRVAAMHAESQAEIVELRAENQRLKNDIAMIENEAAGLHESLAATDAKVTALERMREYVRHKDGCRKLNPYEMGFECTCGASAAIAKEGE